MEANLLIISSENDYELKINSPTSGETDTITCDNPYNKLRDIIPQNVISRKYFKRISF